MGWINGFSMVERLEGCDSNATAGIRRRLQQTETRTVASSQKEIRVETISTPWEGGVFRKIFDFFQNFSKFFKILQTPKIQYIKYRPFCFILE